MADGYGAKLQGTLPSQPIIVYNFKAADHAAARMESLGYCQVLITQFFEQKALYCPVFILPCTKTHIICLCLCVGP